MKKNVMMRLACFLLVAVLISTSAISGTYAKYVTQDSGADEARVAKWGIALQVIGDLYADTYLDTPTDWTANTLTVQAKDLSAADANVVAPGTKNESGLSFGLTGIPEVDYIVTGKLITQNIFLKENTYGVMIPVEAGVINEYNFAAEPLFTSADGENFAKADAFVAGTQYYTLQDKFTLDMTGTKEFYYPVVYSMSGAKLSHAGSIHEDSLKAIAQKIADAMSGKTIAATTAGTVSTFAIAAADSTVRNSNTAIEDIVKLGNNAITWEWAFERGNPVYDSADTVLGNLMAARKAPYEGIVVKAVDAAAGTYTKPIEGTDYCLDTQFSIDITVTQVD